MSENLSQVRGGPDTVRPEMSEAEEELEFIAILFLGIFGLLIARPIGAVVQFVRDLRGRQI